MYNKHNRPIISSSYYRYYYTISLYLMPKRPIPSSARTPRCAHRSRLVSPLASSTGCHAPTPNVAYAQSLFATPVVPILDILEHRIDASVYSLAQLSWLLLHDIHRFNTCLDFARCEDSILSSLFPSKYGGSSRVPMSHRHTPTTIHQFQRLGNKQQLHLISKDIVSPLPLIPELITYK